MSFAQEAVDKSTRNLAEDVARLAAEIERETGAAWHRHAGAHQALTRAIQLRLEVLKPEGSIVFGDRPHATVPHVDPNQLGAITEHRLRRYPDFTDSPTRAFMEEEYQRSRTDPDVVARVAALNRLLLDTPLKADPPKKRGKR